MKYSLLLVSAAAVALGAPVLAQDTGTGSSTPATTSDTAAPSSQASGSAVPSTPASDNAANAGTADATAGAPTTPATGAADAPAASAEATNTAVPDAATGAAPSATASASTPGGAVDPAKAAAADQMIAQNWTKYDKDNKGQLTALQFGEWVMAAQGQDLSGKAEKTRQSRSAGLTSTKVLNATAAEFSKADADKDRQISRDELRSYLAG